MGKGAKKVNRQKRETEKERENRLRQQKFERKETKRRLSVQLENMKREIEFKKGQLESGKIVETRSVHRMPDGAATIVDGYTGGLKPKHILINEYTELESQCELWAERISEINKAEEDDAREITN